MGLNEVSNAIGRLGFPELVPELTRLLDEELSRLKKAREGLFDARRRGDTAAFSDATMHYDNQYCQSFICVGGDEVAAVVPQYLEERLFGFSAALILKAISDKQLNVPEPDFHRQWPWFEEVASARARRTASTKSLPANTLWAATGNYVCELTGTVAS